MRQKSRAFATFAFWALLTCCIINAYLFFISLSVPQLAHLKEHHLFMVVFCAIGTLANYFRLDKMEP